MQYMFTVITKSSWKDMIESKLELLKIIRFFLICQIAVKAVIYLVPVVQTYNIINCNMLLSSPFVSTWPPVHELH